jgi:porin
MTSFGRNVTSDAGTLLPPAFSSLLPQPGEEDVSALFELTFTQFLSEKVGFAVGKLSGLGFDGNAFAHDYHSQFVSTGLNFNMALALFPLDSFGGALVVLPWDGATLTASIVGPDGDAVSNDPAKAFEHGVLVASEGRVQVEPFGLVGHQLVGFGWSNKRRYSLAQEPANLARLLLQSRFPRLGDPGPVLERFIERFFPGLVPTQPANREDSTWAVWYNFDQYLWSPEGHPDRGIGLFFRFGAADEDTNPVHYAYNVGLSGNGIVPGRPADRFGVGWSRVELSGNLVPFLRQQLDLGLEREDTVEVYYNAALTPWLGASLDLQVTRTALTKALASSTSGLRDIDTAVILGMRLYARF